MVCFSLIVAHSVEWSACRNAMSPAPKDLFNLDDSFGFVSCMQPSTPQHGLSLKLMPWACNLISSWDISLGIAVGAKH